MFMLRLLNSLSLSAVLLSGLILNAAESTPATAQRVRLNIPEPTAGPEFQLFK